MEQIFIDAGGVYMDAIVKSEFIRETFSYPLRASKRFNRALNAKEILPKITALFPIVVLHIDDDAILRPDDDTLMFVEVNDSRAFVAVASRNRSADLNKYIDLVESVLPAKSSSKVVPFTFWSGGGTFAQSYKKNLVVPAWNDIKDNYAAPVQEALGKLMNHKHSNSCPRIIVFHGDSGTGKTYAIRALAEKWGHWASIEYITDPLTLFESTSYMLNVMEEGDEDEVPHATLKSARILIVEDCGTLLAPEASVEMEQALGNVLNLANGLLGQSYGTYLLFTTNNKVRERHPAIMRNGRLLADIEFSALSAREAVAWGARNGVSVPAKDETIANLYALIEGEQIVTKAPAKTMGFR